MGNNKTDQTEVLAGLREMKKGMGLLSGFLATIMGLVTIIALMVLIDPWSLRSLGFLMNEATAWIFTLATIAIIGLGLIFTQNGIKNVQGATAHGHMLGSIGPNKLLATLSVVSFGISAFFILLALGGLLNYRLMGLAIVPFILFAICFFFYFIFMTFVAESVGESIGQPEIMRKARMTRTLLLIIMIVTFLQYTLSSMIYDRDIVMIIQVIGIASQALGVYAHISNIKLWNYTAANYHEKSEIQGASATETSAV